MWTPQPYTARGLLHGFLWPSAWAHSLPRLSWGQARSHVLPGCCTQRHIPLPVPSCSLPMGSAVPGHGSTRLWWSAIPLLHFPQLLVSSLPDTEQEGFSSSLECGCLPWWPLHRVGTAESPCVCCLLVVRDGRELLEWASAPFLLCLQLLAPSSAEEQGWHHPCAAHHHLCMPPWWRQCSSWLDLKLAFHGSPCFSISGPAAGTAISSEM